MTFTKRRTAASQPASIRRADAEGPARHALARVVVGLALQGELDAGGQPGAEALARGAEEARADGPVGQPVRAEAPGDLPGEDPAHSPVDVPHRQLVEHDLRARVERRPGLLHQTP